MKKRQTMGKMMRDRELKERRAMKQQKKDERRLAPPEGESAANELELAATPAGDGESTAAEPALEVAAGLTPGAA